MSVAEAEQTEERTEDPQPRRRVSSRLLLWAVVPIPALLAIAEALRSPRMNFNDYWTILAKVTWPDGSLRSGQLFDLYNEHPITLVGPLFWLDAKFFHAYNYVLGLFNVLLVAVIFVVLVRMLPARLTGTARVAVIAGLSLLLFSSAALEFFGMGMSGLHWLVGLVPAVVAVYFAQRGQTVLAAVFAAIGCFGHGSAFPVWVALALIAWLRRDRLWQVLLPIGLGVVTIVLWLLPARPPSYPAPTLLGADTILGTTVATLGQVFAARSTDLAFVAGTIIAAFIAFVVVKGLRDRSTVDDAGWVGLAVLVVLVAVMVGISRAKFNTGEGLTPRYAMIALLGAAAFLVLVTRFRRQVVPLTLLMGVTTYAVGSAHATDVRANYPQQPMLAVAMRVEAPSVIENMNSTKAVLPILRSLKAYPFTDDFTLGCGKYELGSLVDMSQVAELPGPVGSSKTAGAVETGPVTGDTKMFGWAVIDGHAADCVMVVDGGSVVVGGGAVGVPRPDVAETTHGTGRAGWHAVAKPGVQDAKVLVRSGERLYRISLVIKV
ncbi:hypothetical protein Lesp02_48150 [Lentzea sp. NBRC 105346]|uniref:hypothetical protein n=1 Tax=Lentzea sp. NBRC 105346 TaxID=3032205 RepID=UPI0024A32FC6|nr:hypothetical protein [Lentzea sp. NBRC 105346]GLZ32627.1 hypothetical protein Lesp02_48150 [Lentzea sp. NBRC 105346]